MISIVLIYYLLIVNLLPFLPVLTHSTKFILLTIYVLLLCNNISSPQPILVAARKKSQEPFEITVSPQKNSGYGPDTSM